MIDPFRTRSASAHLFPGLCLCLQDSAHWASVFRVFWKMGPLGKASWSTYPSFADVCKYLSGVWYLHTAKGSGPDSAPVFRAHSIFLIKKKSHISLLKVPLAAFPKTHPHTKSMKYTAQVSLDPFSR